MIGQRTAGLAATPSTVTAVVVTLLPFAIEMTRSSLELVPIVIVDVERAEPVEVAVEVASIVIVPWTTAGRPGCVNDRREKQTVREYTLRARRVGAERRIVGFGWENGRDWSSPDKRDAIARIVIAVREQHVRRGGAQQPVVVVPGVIEATRSVRKVAVVVVGECRC